MSDRRASRTASTYRDFPGRRWLIVGLRALHLAGVVGVGAQLLTGLPAAPLFAALLVASGVAMAALDAWSNREYLVQYSGAAMLLKLALLVGFLVAAEVRLPLFWIILVLSALVAHAPARLRHRRMLRPQTKT